MNRRVIAAVSDLFFASKIRGTAEHLNVTVEFARGGDALFDAAKTEVPALVILDLHATQLDPFAVAARLKADEQLRAVPVVAFFSHVETELRRKALEAGVEHVLPRSVFTRRLADILAGEI
ncbi:MAG TPA: response regulator [Pyrinomonadaceae bacterium]|nr:response regulator [Pyrinomonadaceae bacterium]